MTFDHVPSVTVWLKYLEHAGSIYMSIYTSTMAPSSSTTSGKEVSESDQKLDLAVTVEEGLSEENKKKQKQYSPNMVAELGSVPRGLSDDAKTVAVLLRELEERLAKQLEDKHDAVMRAVLQKRESTKRHRDSTL